MAAINACTPVFDGEENAIMSWHRVRLSIIKIVISTIVLVVIGVPLLAFEGAPVERSVSGLFLFGLLLGAAEEFYLQASRGEWIRRQHQLLSLLVGIVTAFVIACVAILINLVFWGDLAQAPDSFRALVGHLPIFFILIAVLVLLLRVAGFIGGRTLLRLLTGYYHRPVIEQRVLAFVDVKDSAAIVEQLGPLRGKEAISRVVTILSELVIEHGGDIYLFTGDGLIATWDRKSAVTNSAFLGFAQAALAMVDARAANFRSRFGITPKGIRIGIHGGEVVVSEQGDVRRSIGIWGDTINIAARLEQACKEIGEDCLISRAALTGIDTSSFNLVALSPIKIKGISEPIAASALRRDG